MLDNTLNMRILLLILATIPSFLFAQSRKKKALAEQQAIAAMNNTLKSHVQFLANDILEGRRTGTHGEEMAMNYLVNQYKLAGIAPGTDNGYVQPFDINEGKKITDSTSLIINDKVAILNQHYFPLPYSAQKTVQSFVAMSLNEAGNIWFKDIKDLADNNPDSVHFDADIALKKYSVKAASKGATALIIYNSANTADDIQFNKYDTSKIASIPVIYLTKLGRDSFFSDNTAMQKVAIAVSITSNFRTGHNVVAFINNNAPNTVILGAHFDHLGYGEDHNALDTGHIIHNGADDNASGTAALLELAKKLNTSQANHNNYLIIHFSAEELGLLGSKYWLNHPTRKISPNYMINMDMVGRYDSAKKLTIGGYGTSSKWGSIFSSLTNKNLLIKFDSSGTGPSDHASFYRDSIPVLFFFTGTHPDYHKASDDWNKLNYDGEREILNYIYQLITSADDKGKLTFSKTREASARANTHFKVTLGIIPDYGYTGIGVRIDGTSPGKQAEKIGLQAGDVLLQLGDYKFVDLNYYMEALGKFKKGDSTKLIIKRKGEERVFNVQF